MNPKADFYFKKDGPWYAELTRLRTIIVGCGLVENVKWGTPCYTFNASNIVLIHVFKEYCAMLFFKGALMNDPENLLVQQTENVQSARQIRFTSVKEIRALESTIKKYIQEAIRVEKAGLKVERKKTEEYDVPEEFGSKLAADPDLKRAFHALTPGRQRGYLLHFSSPKQSKTRTARVEKSIPHILDGKGLNDD